MQIVRALQTAFRQFLLSGSLFSLPGSLCSGRLQLVGPTTLVAAVAFVASPAVMAAESIQAATQGETIAITIDGKPFTTLNLRADQKKPYFWPLLAEDGAVLTRVIDPKEKEHPHHRGLWLSVDEVNHAKHWVEREKIANRKATIVKASGNEVQILLENEWLDNKETPVLKESTLWTLTKDRLITADITLTPLVEDVTIGDTKEGFFAVRIAQTMREDQGGKLLTAHGEAKAKDAWGKTPPWIDYSGKVGDNIYGITLFDSPNNFRPSRYHVRDYGLFAISPFGEAAYQERASSGLSVNLHKSSFNKELKLRYGVWIHNGTVSMDEIEKVYDQFLEAPKAAE